MDWSTIEGILKIAGPTGTVGALLLVPKIRALLWELILMVAIAIAKKHYDAEFAKFKEEMEAKIGILIEALGNKDQREDITARMRAVRPSESPKDEAPKGKRR